MAQAVPQGLASLTDCVRLAPCGLFYLFTFKLLNRMANREKKTTQPGAGSAASTQRIMLDYGVTRLSDDTDELFTSIESMLTTLSGALDRDPERMLKEDMAAFCWQVYMIGFFVGDLKQKVSSFEHC